MVEVRVARAEVDKRNLHPGGLQKLDGAFHCRKILDNGALVDADLQPVGRNARRSRPRKNASRQGFILDLASKQIVRQGDVCCPRLGGVTSKMECTARYLMNRFRIGLLARCSIRIR
jgi:hypothetical protein